MKPSTEKVLNLLRRKKRSGCTFDDVPKGTCITKRISELRHAGYDIITMLEKISNGSNRADVLFLRYLRQNDRQVGANA